MKSRLKSGLLLLLLLGVAMLFGCASPPVATLDDVRSVVSHAYASGAARYAPGEYQLASSALLAAEQQVEDGDYRKALNTLELARRYSSEALNITLEHKRKLAEEQRRLAEEKRLEQQRRERERERVLQQEKLEKEKAQKAAAEKKAAEAAEEKLKKETAAKKKAVEIVKPKLVIKVEVGPGENLAMLAEKKEVYGDRLLWPLIYKANRDQIKDPKEIFAGQIFIIPRDKNREEEDAARLEAKELKLFVE